MTPSGGSRSRKMGQTAWPAQVEKAFRLVELLVGLAVIAVLAALLLPALGRAKEGGRGAACISNLRQIGVALQLYVQDNRNRLPIIEDQPLTNSIELNR